MDNEKKTFLYYPQEDMINDSVEDYGLTDEMMQEAYISRARFDGEERLLYCGVWEDDYLFTAASVSEITLESVSRGIYISLAGVMTQLICFLIILLSAGKHSEASPGLEEEWKEEAEKDMVERLAANRISGLLRLSLFVFSAVVSTLILLKEVLFKNYEILLNLLNGNWNTGIHVFSVTACWIDCCLIFFAMSIVLILLELVGQLMNSRGETVVRMLISFTRYIAVIGTVFHCARLLGAPTDTLLASAGILTIVVGLGAQSLVTDVLAGLFVIFEKAFKVGDIIMMDNWRGRVLEIGIRNTRVMDILDNNIKIIHNSSLNQIVNLSDLPTYLYTTIGTEYGADLVRIEDILARELPEIHERIPQAIEGPFYRGVSELGDSCVELKFLTVCRNEDYYVVKYAVNREIKLVFDRYSIQVPFPQIVINYRDREKGSEEEE